MFEKKVTNNNICYLTMYINKVHLKKNIHLVLHPYSNNSIICNIILGNIVKCVYYECIQ